VANQYISQMSQEVRDAVFGNVGTIVSFRISPDDAPLLEKYFAPQFEAADLIQMHNRNFVASMTIAGEKAAAFSARTLDIPKVDYDYTKQIIELSRSRYAEDKAIVEDVIRTATEPSQVKKETSSAKYTNQNSQKPLQSPQAPKNVTKSVKDVASTIMKVTLKTPVEEPIKPTENPNRTKRRRSRSKRKSGSNSNQTKSEQVIISKPPGNQNNLEQN